MQNLEYEMFKQSARDDFISFCVFNNSNFRPQKFHYQIAEYLQALQKGEIKRLMVSVPPQHGKTTMCTINYPARVLGKDHTHRFIVGSYGADLSQMFSNDTQNVVKSSSYMQLFDTQLVSESTSHRSIKGGGFYHAVGIGGPVTGISMDTGIVDDPFKTRQEAESPTYRENIRRWFTNSLLTRQQGNAGKIISIMTRWHIDDLAGRLEELEDKGGQRREKLVFPAYDDKKIVLRPDKFDMGFLETQKNTLGVRDFAALYMQDPIASSGNIFNPATFKYFVTSDFETVKGLRKQDCVLAIFIDPAFSSRGGSDDAVVLVAAKHKLSNEIYLLDIYAETSAPSHTYEAIFNMADKRAYEGFKIEFISIENVNLSNSQTQFIKDFRQQMSIKNKFYNIYEYNPVGKGKKEDRIKFNLEPRFATGSLYFRKDDPNIKNRKKLEEQLLTFPTGKNDDVIDTVAQCVDVFQTRGSTTIYTPPKREPRSLITGKPMLERTPGFTF